MWYVPISEIVMIKFEKRLTGIQLLKINGFQYNILKSILKPQLFEIVF